MVIGLTGNIGSGKSTASKIFEELGFKTIDSDKLVRQLLEDDAAIIVSIKNRFGDAVLNPDGSVNRKALASIVFSNKAELEWLENLLHPPVIKAFQAQIKEDPAGDWVVEIPLLFEKKLEKYFDYTLCLSSTIERQLERLKQQGFTQKEIESRLACQLPLEEKEKRADFVISNYTTIDILREQITSLVQELRNA